MEWVGLYMREKGRGGVGGRGGGGGARGGLDVKRGNGKGKVAPYSAGGHEGGDGGSKTPVQPPDALLAQDLHGQLHPILPLVGFVARYGRPLVALHPIATRASCKQGHTSQAMCGDGASHSTSRCCNALQMGHEARTCSGAGGVCGPRWPTPCGSPRRSYPGLLQAAGMGLHLMARRWDKQGQTLPPSKYLHFEDVFGDEREEYRLPL